MSGALIRLQKLLLLLLEFGVSQHAVLVELAELLQLLDHVGRPCGRRCGRRRSRGLLALDVLEPGILIGLPLAALLHLLSRKIRAAADHGGTHEGPSASQHGYAPTTTSEPWSASWSFWVSSSESDVLMTVPPNLLSAATALSGVTFSTTMNRAEVPGFSMSRT